MAAQIHQFICRSDNFAVLMHDPATRATATIDAPDAKGLLAALDERGWELTHILVTHHHADHVEGIPALAQRFPQAEIVAPAKDRERVPGAATYVSEGDAVTVGSLRGEVIETPGHTSGHIVYWFDDSGVLFAGDTLFAMGCGRVMEAPMATMWRSLEKLMRLPGEGRVFCGHEYTLANAKFALTVDPDNARLKARAAKVEQQRAQNLMTLPSTIELELATNPFLRAADPAVQKTVGLPGADPAQVFAEVRERKNRF